MSSSDADVVARALTLFGNGDLAGVFANGRAAEDAQRLLTYEVAGGRSRAPEDLTFGTFFRLTAGQIHAVEVLLTSTRDWQPPAASSTGSPGRADSAIQLDDRKRDDGQR